MENENEINKLGSSGKMTGKEVVISGISGVFPNSDSVLEFCENLFNKVDMVSGEPRWTSTDPEVPKHVGKISGIDKFDAQFFKVGYQQAKVLEPISRKILEHAHGAIFDSGNTHATLKGTKIGVFVGASFTDFCTMSLYDIEHHSDFVVGGSSKAMLANRISYWVDGKGPSYCLDFSCASSAAALEKAYNSIRDGDCDAAVVGSGNICSHPLLSLNLRKAGLLCVDGKTKCFDKNADGYVRSEAVSLLFLQRAKDAKRIYAEIYHAKGIYELKPDAQFLPVRKSEDIQKFLTDFYSETDIGPEIVEYVEANGAAIAKADENELDAIGKVFANKKLVKIGCVKSNMGHSEAASGLAAVTKICLSYHKGEIPANLHYNEPLDIPAVCRRNVQILTEHAKFNRGFTAVNNFSFTGANYHVVLKGHYKMKDLDKYKCQVPRIVLASGREEPCVNKIFNSLRNKPIDPEEIALLHNIFEKDIVGHTGRGYTVLNTTNQSETASISESVDYYSGVRRPLWFVYSGMGSQWAGMGAELMRIPTFMRAIERCHKVLEAKGVDIVKIISDPDKTLFDNILNAFVGIGAIQIGLTDILKEMGVEPDYIMGHSLGEMACAYHDNTFTAEELILATYSRGKAVLEAQLVKGSMAAVGVGYRALLNQCPPEIDIGCHNSSESTTISGPAEVIKQFVAKLTKQGIFAREVQTANIAYHSRYVAGSGPILLRSLQEVIKHPKLRSKKWISTSIPKERWDEQMAKFSSAEYHANNLLSPVYFEEVSSMIPTNAVIVEIGPHGLLQAILKRSHPECTHISLTKRECQDSVNFLLDSIGKLYQAGYNPKVSILYPKVEFPVSTETPLLSHLVEWEHSETWPLLVDNSERISASTYDLIISIHDDDYKYIADNVKNGVTTIPEATLMVYVWKAIAKTRGVDFQNMSIIFKDIEFHSDVIIKTETTVKLSVMIFKGSDKFEIRQDATVIVSGIASSVRNITFQHAIDSPDDDFDDIRLNAEDIYKILSMRGYSYKNSLKSIHSININRNNAFVKWKNDWVLLLDSLIQLNTLTRNYRGISKPKYIRKLRICVKEQIICKLYPVNGLDYHVVQMYKALGITRCAGVEIDNITYEDKPLVETEPDVMMNKSFFPHFATGEVAMKTALEINLQIIGENSNSRNIKIINLITSTPSIFGNVKDCVDCLLDFNVEIKSANLDNTNNSRMCLDIHATNVLVVENSLGDSKAMKNLYHELSIDDFVLTLEKQIPNNQTEIKRYFRVLACMSDGKQILMQLKKLNRTKNAIYFPIAMDDKFSWVSSVYGELVTTKKVVLISEKQPFSGLLGFVKQMKRDGYNNIALVAILDFHAQPFNCKNEFYKDQLEKNLSVNVLKKSQWGGYYYTSCAKSINLRNFTLKNIVPGDIDKLSWIEAPPRSAEKVLVQVYYSGVSLNDCHKATNDFKSDTECFGMDFSGIDKNGDKVMGIINGGATSSTVEADPDLLWPVPDHWSLEDAATVPLPYVHAYYCLVMKAKLTKGQRVLVIGGAGALGQALISLSLAIGCTVFTTVSELEKKKVLLKLFPQLNENHICYSESDSIINMIIKNAQKKGCHVVISNATGYLREAAMKCVGFGGFFLDVCKHDMIENKNIGMSYFSLYRSFKAVDLSNIFKSEYVSDKKILQQCLSEGISRGIVTPLTRVVYSPAGVSRAFRLLSMRRNRGRVLLRLKDPVIMNQGLNVSPRLTYAPQDVVIIVCDEKGLGIELADRLIERGLRKIILHIRSNLVSGYMHTKFISWSKHEVSVELSSENLHIEQGCASLVKNAMKFGKVKGVFIVQDGNRDDNGGKNDFISAYNNKCLVVLNLDLASRNCALLSHFTIVTHLTQNASEEYALSLSERVCELRNEMGLPALVIRHESLAELSESQSSYSTVKSQSISTFFNSLEISLKMKYRSVITFDLREKDVDFYRKLARILGVRDIKDLENGTTLQDLNLNEISLKELRAAIKNSYQIDYPVERIRSLTVKSLKELYANNYRCNTDFDSGMNAFYKKIDNEEYHLSSQPIIAMPTLLNYSSDVNIDPNGTYLIMIPGFDGDSECLKAAAERIKIQAVGVKLGPDMEGDSIREMAENIRKEIKTKFETKSKFYILGYSFGVDVALELAAMFEEEGIIGVVYCLDSSPDTLRIQLDAYTGSLSEDKLQNTVLHHMYYLMAGNEDENLRKDLETSATFNEKVESTLKKLKEVISYSEQYKRHVLESAYKRIKLAREYKSDILLKSELILMKGIAHPRAENLSEDYNLSQYTQKPVKMFNLESDHGLAYQDTRVSNIINKFLDKEILEAFKKFAH